MGMYEERFGISRKAVWKLVVTKYFCEYWNGDYSLVVYDAVHFGRHEHFAGM